MMIVGLIDHADRLGKSARGTQHALSEQIQELAQLQQWAANAALEIQKRADAAIKGLEAERARIQGSQMNLERNAVQALHDAVEKQSAGIGRQVENALATPLHDIKQAAAQVRQNVKDSKWLFVVSIFFLGVVGGLLFGYFFVMRTQSRMDDRLTGSSSSSLRLLSPLPQSPIRLPQLTKGKRSRHGEHGPHPRQAMDLTRKRLGRGKSPASHKPTASAARRDLVRFLKGPR